MLTEDAMLQNVSRHQMSRPDPNPPMLDLNYIKMDQQAEFYHESHSFNVIFAEKFNRIDPKIPE